MTEARETGQEQSKEPCPECGRNLPLETSAYGSTVPGKCPTCYKAPTKADVKEANQTAAEAVTARELGTDVKS